MRMELGRGGDGGAGVLGGNTASQLGGEASRCDAKAVFYWLCGHTCSLSCLALLTCQSSAFRYVMCIPLSTCFDPFGIGTPTSRTPVVLDDAVSSSSSSSVSQCSLLAAPRAPVAAIAEVSEDVHVRPVKLSEDAGASGSQEVLNEI